MKTVGFLFLVFITGILHAQESSLWSDHTLDLNWERMAPDHKDSAKCTFHFKWIACRGTDSFSNLVNKEIFRLSGMLVSDSCSPDSLTESCVEWLAQHFRQEWKDALKGAEKMPSFEKNIQIEYWNSDGFISLIRTENMHTGGAHGHSSIHCTVVQKTPALVVKDWQSLFSDPKALIKVGEAQFMEKYKVSDIASLESDWFHGNSFYLPPVFFIGPVGIVFCYTQEDLSIPGDQYLEFTIPFEKLDALALQKLH